MNRIALLGADDVVVSLTERFTPKDFGGLQALIANSGEQQHAQNRGHGIVRSGAEGGFE